MAEGGPTQVMRTEHRMIGDCLEAIHHKVQAQDPESDQDDQRLLDILKSHNMKEERILYPSIDQVISDQERAELYQAMKEKKFLKSDIAPVAGVGTHESPGPRCCFVHPGTAGRSLSAAMDLCGAVRWCDCVGGGGAVDCVDDS